MTKRKVMNTNKSEKHKSFHHKRWAKNTGVILLEEQLRMNRYDTRS